MEFTELEIAVMDRALELEASVFMARLMLVELKTTKGRMTDSLSRNWVARLGIFEIEMQIAACILKNPEWEVELRRLVKGKGCPAQTVSAKRDFLIAKGVLSESS